ncbi:MAG: hypothetical protein J1F18_14660, partial [Lachnospiraceae bacterium]|nr:hypothetical protein [Lachnospiraceae bacterium]
AKSLQELYAEYNRLASIQGRTTSEEEEFKTAVEDITKALGNKAAALEGLTAGTNEYADALAKATKEELLSASVDATVGRKSAEEELQNAIWDQWKGSLISVDANSKGNALSEEAQKAVDIVSDALKDFETINRTWNNLSWDGATHDDPVAIFEYYNALIKAREQLVLASQDDEELLNTEIYKDMNSAINTMSESLDSYIEKLYEEEKMLYMAQNSIPSTTEEYKAMEAAMVNVAGESVDLQNKFKELLSADFSSLAVDIESVYDAISDTATQVQAAFPLFNQLTTSQEELDRFQSSVKSASDAYANLLSGNYSSSELFDSIQTINKAVSDMKGSLNWEEIDSLDELQNKLEDISSAYAESILSGVGVDINSEFGQMLTNIIQQMYEAEAEFEAMNSQLDNLQSSYQTLTGILESYNKTGYLTLDNIQSLVSADANLIQMLEVENGKLALNQEAYENLVAVQLLEFKTKLNDAAAAEIEILAKNKAEEATNNNAQASENAVAKLDAETAAFGRNTSAAIANAVAKAEEAGVSESEIQGVFDKYTAVWESALKNYNGNFDSFMGGAKSAGKKSGDAYVEAFEKELSKLKDLRDRGVIDEAEYLRRLRELYTRYFKDRKKYLDEFNKYERQYLEGMKSLYDSALSGISTLMDRKISAASDAKNAAIDALNEEKEAAQEAYQKQIDAIDELISKKQKQIDSINEEIKKIQDAAKARKLNLDIQQQEYNLARMQNQKTQLLYKDGQFVYDVDTSGIREANEKLTELKEEKQISELEKQIDLIEKEIDLLEEQKSSIQKMMDETNKYYENLIKEQEKYWDSMIENLENQKSKWEELADIQKIAEAWSAVEQVFGDLGYTVEDVLNGNEQAFEDFKSKYISLMNDMNSNASFAEGLSYASGVAKEELGSFLDKTKETADGLDELGAKGNELDSVASSMDSLSGSASTAGKSVS